MSPYFALLSKLAQIALDRVFSPLFRIDLSRLRAKRFNNEQAKRFNNEQWSILMLAEHGKMPDSTGSKSRKLVRSHRIGSKAHFAGWMQK